MARPYRIIEPSVFDTVCDLKAGGEGARRIAPKTGLKPAFVSLIFKECNDPVARARRTGTVLDTIPSSVVPPMYDPNAHLLGSNGVTSSYPGFLPDLKEDSATDLLINQLFPTDDIYLNLSLLPYHSIPSRNEDLPSMLSSAVHDLVNSIPGMAVNSWKNNMISSMWRKFNPPSNECSSTLNRSMVAEVKRQMHQFNEKTEQEKNDLLERINELQKRHADALLPPVHSADQSSESGTHSDPPANPYVGGLASLPPAVIACGTTDRTTAAGLGEENKLTEADIKTAARAAPGESGPSAGVNGSKTPDPPIDIASKAENLSKPCESAGVMMSPLSTVITAGQAISIETPSVAADSNTVRGQLSEGALNTPTVEYVIQPNITQHSSPLVQPTILPSTDTLARNLVPEVAEKITTATISTEPATLQSVNGSVSSLQSKVASNVESNGDDLLNIVLTVATVAVSIYTIQPLLRTWIFKPKSAPTTQQFIARPLVNPQPMTVSTFIPMQGAFQNQVVFPAATAKPPPPPLYGINPHEGKRVF